jgi:hypothetical protein
MYDAQHPKATRKKLAFGADFAMKSYALIVGALSFYFSKLNFVHTAKDTVTQLILLKRMRMAAFTGIFGLVRCGEYLVSNKGKAAPFKNSDIWFFDYHNNRISFEMIGIVPAKYLKIMIPFSKTDSSGWGRIVTHYRISTKIGNRDLCFVDEAVQWICETRRLGSTENDLFLHLPGFGQLPKADLEKFMNVAIENWYDTNETDLPIAARKYATSHSLRYGGATMLAAAGMPEYLIEYYGGWAPGSKAKSRYTQLSESLIQLVSECMSSAAHTSTSRFFMQETAMALNTNVGRKRKY